jgi:hypothetical protein
MTRKTSSNGQQHMERRARGLSRELDRLLWERMRKAISEATATPAQAVTAVPAR